MLSAAARPQPPQEEPKLPRTLLQQHCQREKLPMPRFEKLAPGGFRLPQAGIRYTVTLEPAAQSSGPKRKGQQVHCTLLLFSLLDVLGHPVSCNL